MTKSRSDTTQHATRRIPGIAVPTLKKQGRLRSRNMTPHPSVARVAPAFYVGWQEGTTELAGFSLYTLVEEIPGHAQWSTVSGNTLIKGGFMLPDRSSDREHARSRIYQSSDMLEATKAVG